MVVVFKHIVPKGYQGITLFPIIFLKERRLLEDKCLLNHEMIHVKQQQELLIIFFYLWYIVEFFIKLFKYRSRNKAYRAISFEREAYVMEKNVNYINERPRWAFIKYIW